jgi:flagellin-like protein
MVNKKGINTIVAVLLLIMITFVAASTMYFWITKMQVESQETTTHYQDKTLGNVITEAKIVSDPIYNTLAEGNICLPATLSFMLQNTGAKNIQITNSTEIIVSDANGVICLNTFTGTCTDSEDRLYIGVQNNINNANISYSTDGSTWVQGDDNVGTLYLWDSTIYDEKIYYGSTYDGAPSETKGGQTFKTCDFNDWTVDTSFVWSNAVNDLTIFNESLYAATSSTEEPGRVYRKYTNSTWEQVWESEDPTVKVNALTTFDGYIYAGASNNITRSSDGITWTEVNNTLGNVSAMFVYDQALYVGLYEGEIWRSPDGLLFEATNLPYSYSSISAFEEFNGVIYAGTSNNTNASILSLSGADWSIVNNSKGDNIYDFAIFNNKLYAAVSGEDNAGVISSADGITWAYAYSGENITTITNYTYCSNKKVTCIQGCGSDLVPGETRAMEIQLSNTACDMTDFGTSTEYKFRINFGSSAAISGRFGKELISSSNSNSRCEYTYPFCNGACTVGTCIAAPLGQECFCAPAEPCEAIDSQMFSCSIGTCGTGTCTINAQTQICECI